MDTSTDAFAPFERALEAHRAAPIVVDTFRHYYRQLVAGASGLIAESDIEPVASLPDAEALPPELVAAGREALARTVMIKLNGGLGTSMGLDKAKSLLIVKDGLSFLDIIARQVLTLRRRHGAPVPLLFMNSFATEADTLEALRPYPELAVPGLPLTFLQNKIPKVLEQGHRFPDAAWGERAWCPPGHGDLYTALHASGLLESLLERGFTHAFVSNADNLGASLELGILGYVSRGLPFLMEAADRTAVDRKGGHLARRTGGGRLLLREVAQCSPHDVGAFQDVTRHRYFNTNNIWIDLRALRALLGDSGGIFRLPLIRNRKPIDPRDPSSPAVVQMETAMGAAIELFDGAAAVRVPRSRFAPVKVCGDLLALWSDAYALGDDGGLVARCQPPPLVLLHDRCYARIDDMRARFPHGAPSLVDCRALDVHGDVTFGRGVVARGRVWVRAATPARVDDGRVLEGEVTL